MKRALARLLPALLAAGAASAAWAQSRAAVPEQHRWLTFAVFTAIIALTMFVTYVAARRVRTPADFYTAGGGLSGLQNGWAIAGDYLSAASFLGVAGLISLWGYDGFMYSVGWLVAYISVLLVIAEPCRNIGKYTLSDLLAYRNDPKLARVFGALSVITVSTFYLVAQMVGGGMLVKTLIGIDYEISVVAVGSLMLAYVIFGGMVATTWVQIIKAVLLVAASLLMVVLVWRDYGFFGGFLDSVVGDARVQQRVAAILGDGAAGLAPAELGQRFLEPGLLFRSPLDQISLGVALVFGTAGLPHILMRFFTVPTARAARSSVVWAMAIIGGFYLLTLFLGLGAALKVGAPAIMDIDGGGNMAAPLLAQALGGGPESLLGNFMLAFVAAVAFATIVAVVAGLVLAAASAIAHDLYVGVVRDGQASTETQVRAARVATVAFGVVAIVLGIAAKGQNVAHLVALAFAVAASANFPCLFMTLFWRRCNTAGIVAGMLVGTLAAIGLVLVSPNMTYPKAVKAAAQQVLDEAPQRLRAIETALAAADFERVEQAKKERAALGRAVARARDELERYRHVDTSLVGLEAPLFELRNPGLLSLPLGFLALIVASLLYRDPRAEAMWDEVYVRQNTGALLASAARLQGGNGRSEKRF
ncbi:cation acetate symporter [Azospira restricta]|uniref:Cation acetate symporter n=1 Tax=Azospira restricta TaxID=404405 RepID=A0A974SRA1_9RHOO|nr:cation acetate symporter [Azospira restricta]QRJ65022.1 cation acetate symporter [Azospira restricta]